ncbi:hypothetical protein L1987_17834 [Smallanthus sonchifolius]|uniref:Uncharacterized protein n=1 Tax=Smallanthus sonchifolius TaxID=185202 RepID=A0ACB9IZK2_9ASTR|nr:hypothetical protein L1987_17834 [Smallanthus sonchifolius]
MSEISRDMNTSADMSMRMDLFQYYIRGIGGLISVDDFSPSPMTNSRLVEVGNGSFRNNELAKEETRCNERNRPAGFSTLFCNAARDGLSGLRKERLMAMLRQSVFALNGEVDEILDPVLSMLRLRALLAPEKSYASYQDANDKDEFEERAHKRLKVNEPLNVSSASYDLTEEGSLSGRKDVVELEPGKGKSLTRCNYTGCGNYARKSSFDENKSLCVDCSKQGMNELFLGSSSRDDKGNGEVNDDLQVLLENRGPTVEEKMEKHSAELSATLERMKEKLDELIDIVVSSCREMTLAEKHQLRRLIQNLQPQKLDRIAEIIQRGKPPEKQSGDDITVNLQNADNSALWRIYFHVKAVENARKLLKKELFA